MADLTGISDFNSSDGLPPWVVQKLNGNFWNIINKIVDPDVVMVSGTKFPNPRTDESLFYNTNTGNLYIWNKVSTTTWDWQLIDIGYIHVDQTNPFNSQYTRSDEFLWIDTSGLGSYNTALYIWSTLPGNNGDVTTWHSLGEIIAKLVPIYILTMSKQEWLSSVGFQQAVKEIHDHPNDYPIS